MALAFVRPRMLRTLLRFMLIPVLVVVGLALALFGYMIDGVRSAKERATEFCAAVRVGDDPAEVLARATRSEALRSSLVWMPPDGPTKKLEVLFKGGFPRSAHGCEVQAAERVTRAVYFHRR